MLLRAFIVADPVLALAELIQCQCQRLAVQSMVAIESEQLLVLARAHRPEVVICSLELEQPHIKGVLAKLVKLLPHSLIMASYRELSVGSMKEVERFGIKDFLGHPIDPTQVFQAVSHRFGVPIRQHPRYAVNLEVRRADGVLLGPCCDLSLGGLSFVVATPPAPGDSLLLHLMLGATQPTAVRFRVLSVSPEADGAHRVRGQFVNLRDTSLRQLMTFLQQQSTPL